VIVPRQLLVDNRHQARRKLAPRRPHGDARQQRADRHVADVLVDKLGRVPDRVHVDPGVMADAGERSRERLGADPVRRQRDRVDRAPDEVDARPRRLERESERVPAGALAVEADGQPGQLAQLGDQLSGARGLEQSGGVVEHDARRAELRHLPRSLDERVVAARPVQQTRVELPPRGGDGLGCDLEVPRVVERVVKPERVDTALRGAGHEAPDEVVAHRPRADEETAADGEHQRRRRAAPDRADALPRALGAAPDGRVERAAARDLEVGVSRRVEHLGEPEQLGRGHRTGERLL
jgi:hypothetical protein